VRRVSPQVMMTTAKWSVFGRENSPTTAITTKGPFLCYYSRYKQFYKVGRCLGKHALYRQLLLRTLPSNDENKKNTRKVIDTIDRFIGVLVPSNFHFESFCFPVHFLLTSVLVQYLGKLSCTISVLVQYLGKTTVLYSENHLVLYSTLYCTRDRYCTSDKTVQNHSL
jgi:hypothetical protein